MGSRIGAVWQTVGAGALGRMALARAGKINARSLGGCLEPGTYLVPLQATFALATTRRSRSS
jgi:hypothetical protein